MNMMQIIEKEFAQSDPNKSVRPTEKGDSLFYPVDEEDIQSGSRDAIELKPQRSNEDAFFIIPENPQVLKSILFVQISIDLLKKYLPTICSRSLEISKEKQIKIFSLLDKIEEFLIGETNEDHILKGDERVSTGFSKDENDLQQKKHENMQLRQKLMRELYFVESLVHIIYLPFVHGDFLLH
jgi:hypothetical protein